MNTNFTPDTELLIQYLDKALKPEEENALISRLHTDEKLRQELDQLTVAVKFVKNYGLKEKIASVRSEMKKELKNSSKIKRISPIARNLRYAVKIAASLLFLIAGYILFLFIRISPDTIIPSSVPPYSFRASRSDQSQELLQWYEQKEYSKILESNEQNKSDQPLENFIVANSYLGLKDYVHAAEYFTFIIQKENRQYKDESEYYLLQCLIKLNKPDEAIKIAKRIKNDKNHGFYHKITASFLLQLNMLKQKKSK